MIDNLIKKKYRIISIISSEGNTVHFPQWKEDWFFHFLCTWNYVDSFYTSLNGENMTLENARELIAKDKAKDDRKLDIKIKQALYGVKVHELED